MRKIKDFLKKAKLINISIRTKLLLIYLLCVLIPTIIFSYAFFSSTIKSTKNEKLILYRQALDRISTDIESNAISAIELSNTIYPDDTMYQHINKTYTDEKECLEEYSIYLKDAWNKILPYNTNIVLFTVYTNNGTLLNGPHLHTIDYFVTKYNWYEKYSNSKEKTLFMYHSDELTIGQTTTRMISYFRKLDYLKSTKYEHFVKITFRPDMLDRILRTETLPGDLYVVDRDNVIIAQTRQQDSVYKDAGFQSYNDIKTDTKQIILNTPVNVVDGWQVICVLNKDFLKDAYKISWMQVLVLVFSITVFASIIIYTISASLYKRIDVLVKHMGKVTKEEYVLIPETEKGNDEIGLLITTMNSMITKIRLLIEDVYKAQIKETQMELLKKQSELSALQCQVNPHFMFNVLETIRIKSYLRNEFETARIIKYMSKIFRKLLMWDNDLIELQEEISFIKEYLEIQQYRYEDELDFEITVDESLLKLEIPKMTLQTFVDNACEHGFSESQDMKRIKISVHTSDNKIIEMRVYDNGKGITPERIRSIYEVDSKGVGIKNVIGRLKLYYGENFSFRINSEPDEYTEIVLDLDLEESGRNDYV